MNSMKSFKELKNRACKEALSSSNGLFTLVTFIMETVSDSDSDTHRNLICIPLCLWEHVTVLALATLGGATRNRKNGICVTSP